MIIFYVNEDLIIMIYNSCLYLTIIFNICVMKLIIYYLYIQINKFIKLSNKENVFVYIKLLKYELIQDFDKYSLTEVNEYINDIIQIYIDNRCDFNEDYDNKQKIYYNDIDVFIITKRKQIIKDIKQKLLIDNIDFELSILIS